MVVFSMLIILKLLYARLLPPGIFLLVIAVMYWYCCKARYAKGLMLLFALIYLLSINVISDKNPFVIRNGSGRACSNVYITENGAGIWALTFSDAASACPVITR